MSALLAGTGVAVGCGVCGWFVVLRAQVFAGDTLAHLALVGALAAALAGVDVRAGALLGAVAVAVLLGVLPRQGEADVSSGIALSTVSGAAILLITLLARSPRGSAAASTVRALFGSILSLDLPGAAWTAGVSVAAAAAVLLATRPLLLLTLDPERAELAGIRRAALASVFLVLVGAVTAAGTQAVGALLVLGLLAGPGGVAHRLTAEPYRGIPLAVATALGATWGGLALAYVLPWLPPSSAITALVALAYVMSSAGGSARRPRARRRAGA